MAILDSITQANDIKSLNIDELYILSDEIREFLIEHISQTGGHLASNLGAVELTLALHMVCDLPKDKIIWDVGHQSYVHKILTGRKEEFKTLRQYGGISGFPKRCESDCDSFDTGHSSTSISAGLGYVKARDILGGNYKVVSVIGDGSLTGGMAYEALNNAAATKSNFIIVLNDNKMSISENVGGLSTHLATLRTADAYQELKSGVHSSLEKIPFGDKVVRRIQKTKSSLKQLMIPGMIFENLGATYLGPVNGHKIEDMISLLKEASKVNGPVVVHVITEKGKGYEPAEEAPSRFHGTSPFVVETGELKKPKEKADYTDVVSTVLKKIGEQNDKVVAITAAMSDGTGLNRFRKAFPDRFFDVGIAEGHAVTFAAGLAAAGLRPVFAVYSSFLQRGFDQLVSDVCLQNLPVVFAIDRAGLVGADGETHQGIFDLSYLSLIPNLVLMAPKNKWELAAMLRFAVNYDGPIAIRYPRGQAYDGLKDFQKKIEIGKSEKIYSGEQIALFAIGNMVEVAEEVRQLLADKGYSCTLVNARFAKPLDEDMHVEAAKTHKLLVTMEENVLEGGYGATVLQSLNQHDVKDVEVLTFGIDDKFVEHGSVKELRKGLGLDPESMVEKIITAFEKL